MLSLNRVTLIGNLGQDPEIRYLENGVAVGRFSLATTNSYKDAEGNWQNRPTEWHNIVVWRSLAERAEKELKKGMSVYVEGEINYRSFEDKDGVQRKTTDILARSFRPFTDTRSDSPRTSSNFPSAEHDPMARTAAPSNSTPPPSKPATAANTSHQMPTAEDDMGDDLPF
jgi:single-strand DNA-binding protein